MFLATLGKAAAKKRVTHCAESASALLTVVTPDLDRYFRWDEPDCDLSVCLNLATADRLQREALRGLGSSAAERHEVGGMLLGKTKREEDRTLIFIDDFEPVSCSPRKDRFYSLSPAERAKFEAALTLSRTLQTPEVIGFYRSHNRDGMFLSAEDLSLIEHNFRAPENVFLLIKPGTDRACTAGFFFRKNGQIRPDSTESEVPLIPVTDEPALEGVPGTEAAHSVSGVIPPCETPTELTPTTSLQPAGERRQVWKSVAAVVLVSAIATAGILLIRYSRSRHEVPQPAPATAAGKVSPSPETVPPQDVKPRENATGVAPPPRVGASDRAAGRTSAPSHNAEVSAARVAVPIPAAKPNPFSKKPAAPLAEQPELPMRASPDSRPPENVDTVSPQVLQRANPEVPPDVAARLTGDVRVNVEVAITDAGEVSNARVISTEGAFAELLSDSALQAAKSFRFKPAEVNGRAAPSSMVLVFRFRPSNK